MPLAVRLRADQYREITVLLEFHRAFFTVPPSRAFDVTGDAESAYRAALEGIFITAVESGMIGLGEASAHRAFEIPHVVIPVRVGVIGHLRGLDEVARANFIRRDPDGAGANVDQPLEHVGGFRTTGAAIGVDRHRVRVDAAHPSVERVHVVAARRHRSAQPRNIGGEHMQIGPEIAENIDPHRQKPALRVHRHFGGRDVVAALRVADEVLGTISQPAHRSAEPAGRLQNQRILPIDEGLRPEPASYVLRDHAKFIRRDLQDRIGYHVAKGHEPPGCRRSKSAGPTPGRILRSRTSAPCNWRSRGD